MTATREPSASNTDGRDRLWLEVVCLVVILIAGAGVRYWLSRSLPFDERELAVLAGAAFPEAALRVPMIMFAGLALAFFYFLLRRSAGVEAAFAALLLLQTNVAFQERAQRLHLEHLAAPVLLGLLLAWRFRSPPTRLPPALRRACLALTLVLVAWGAWLAARLPERLRHIREEAHAETDVLAASLRDCTSGAIMALEQVKACDLAWPASRSLRQQEAGLQNAARLGAAAHRVTGESAWPVPEGDQVVLLDDRGACLVVVPSGPPADVALEVLRER